MAAVKDTRIVIMNPPFSSRSKMGEKFPQETQRSLRKRVDDLERLLVRNDKDMEDFVDKNASEPCLPPSQTDVCEKRTVS